MFSILSTTYYTAESFYLPRMRLASLSPLSLVSPGLKMLVDT
jgi:hypothetical protein